MGNSTDTFFAQLYVAIINSYVHLFLKNYVELKFLFIVMNFSKNKKKNIKTFIQNHLALKHRLKLWLICNEEYLNINKTYRHLSINIINKRIVFFIK